MPDCLICRHSFEPFLSFGRMPIANGFLTPDKFADEYFFELKVGFCQRCGMVQLAELVDPRRMFHDSYAFFSSTSARMAAHFEAFADRVLREHLTASDPFVVEIGSNDGILLRHFAARQIRHLGIEPSVNVAQVARERGINAVCEFFDEALARRVLAEYGKADAFLGANVMCHIPDLHSVLAGVKLLLKPGGILMFEDPYLGDIVEKTAYDQIYDEHVYYFSVSSISHLCEQHGLELVDIMPQAVHGGSMRYLIVHKGARPASSAVAVQRAGEKAMGLDRPETYQHLRRNVERSRSELVDLLRDLKRQGRRVAGYAATSKSTTVTNYCGLTPDLVEYISDTTPLKQGKFSPGVHIPVKSHDVFAANYPDYALLFGWNHAGEIMAKEEKFKAAGGKWIVYVPRVQVIE
ncbi:MAG: class I SAM-dependent methyltransferase [Acidobacteria bacterium]|nr:class I SAM-dependent methyltransferase [Acidobacteriota bacterium]